jgi:glycerol-3-phosphate acyltransferase PlsY
MSDFGLALLARLTLCFLLGSIPFAVLAMMGSGIDIRKVGSGNPGFNNVLRVSRPRAVITLIGDLGKGLAAIWLVARPADAPHVLWLYGLAAILGHCYSPWLGFDGGKGIATSAGIMLYLYPKYVLPLIGVYVLLRFVGKKRNWLEAGTIASLTGYAVFVLLLFLYEDRASAWFGLAFFALAAWRHKKNFQNLAAAGRA